MDDETFYVILQLCDSAFPTGGFSHSMGVEAAIQNYYIEDESTLKNFILCSLENTGSFCIPYLRASYESAFDLKQIVSLDSTCNVSLLNHVAHRASKQQGKALLTTSYEAFKFPHLHDMKKLVDDQKMHCHFPVAFGVLSATLNIPAEKVGKIFLFNSLRTLIASIVRLGKIGTVQAQNWQYCITKSLDDILSRYWQSPLEEACITYPLVEVLQNSHDKMFSKLFFS